jgi:hypothetical protein
MRVFFSATRCQCKDHRSDQAGCLRRRHPLRATSAAAPDPSPGPIGCDGGTGTGPRRRPVGGDSGAGLSRLPAQCPALVSVPRPFGALPRIDRAKATTPSLTGTHASSCCTSHGTSLLVHTGASNGRRHDSCLPAQQGRLGRAFGLIHSLAAGQHWH